MSTLRGHVHAVSTVLLAVLLLPGCATYVGDRLLKLPRDAAATDADVIEQTRARVRELVESLGLPGERAAKLLEIAPTGVIRDTQPLKSEFIDRQLVLAEGDADIAFASNCIIIAPGILHVSHSGNNVIVADGDVDISHDGSLAQGSLVVSRGRVTIGHAADTLVYAPGGVEISHANGVRAFNTPDRQSSWGEIDNLTIKPLFREEARSGTRP